MLLHSIGKARPDPICTPKTALVGRSGSAPRGSWTWCSSTTGSRWTRSTGAFCGYSAQRGPSRRQYTGRGRDVATALSAEMDFSSRLHAVSPCTFQLCRQCIENISRSVQSVQVILLRSGVDWAVTTGRLTATSSGRTSWRSTSSRRASSPARPLTWCPTGPRNPPRNEQDDRREPKIV